MTLGRKLLTTTLLSSLAALPAAQARAETPRDTFVMAMAIDAINTLVRRGDHWESFNTDTEGARAVLERLGGGELFVLGDGGVGAALRSS